MSLLLLEALAALAIGVFIVWWTMFSGRPKDGDGHASSDAPSGTDARRNAQGPGPDERAQASNKAPGGSPDGRGGD
jgi:hypothetical protein